MKRINKEHPFLHLKRMHTNLYFLGILLITVFTVIYIIIAAKTKEINFFSFFFHSILQYKLLMILSGFYISLLGFGIILMIYSFFNMTLDVKFYKEGFAVSIFLQKANYINYKEITDIKVRVCLLDQKKNKKECRVLFHNNVYSFFVAYPVKGYFDDIEICSKRDANDPSKKAYASREDVLKILKQARLYNALQMPYLPDQNNTKGFKNDNKKTA
ncbi:MAG: hypothetical protein JXB50_01685 [Spirochaetes bacterium]|nr:hypothetical protein [Spirochaetota bacterium]